MSSDELKVVSLCSYLTGGLQPRPEDFAAIKMVKAFKGDPIRGYFDLMVGDKDCRFRQENIGEFLAAVPEVMAETVLQRIEGKATLVPIPNSHVVKPDDQNFATLKLAQDMASRSGGRLNAVPALVFSTPQEKARRGGPRNAMHCYEAYRIVNPVTGPIVLVDDVWTLGGHLKAARWKLEAKDSPVIMACTLGYTTHEHVPSPVGVQETMLDTRWLPSF